MKVVKHKYLQDSHTISEKFVKYINLMYCHLGNVFTTVPTFLAFFYFLIEPTLKRNYLQNCLRMSIRDLGGFGL